MDREKAIQMLKRCEAESYCNHYKQQHCCIGCGQREALDLAIKALQEPTEEVDYCNNCPYISWDKDCISRQDAVDVVHKYFVDAIDKTPHEIDEDGDDVYTDMKAVNELLKHNKHISKAIKALPPVTPTEQTIKEIMDFIGGMNMVDEISNEAYAKISVFVNDGTPTERTGEWIEREDWNGDNYYDCSVCGESFVLIDGTPSMNLYHYCPNCGAKMKGGTENE